MVGDNKPKRKKCRECKQLFPLSAFPEDRVVCNICAQAKRKIATSKGYISYIKRVYSQMKYTHTNRKDNKGHTKADFNITVEDLVKVWERQEGRCALSGIVLTHHVDGSGRKDFNASIDRIVPHDPYNQNNVQLVAYRVNIMKHELTEDLFYWWIRTIHDNMKLKVENNDALQEQS